MSNTLRDEALSGLFAPKSVAIVGASADPSKWGHMLVRSALAGAHRRDIFLVNRHAQEILGRPSVRHVADLDVVPELAVVAVPTQAFEDTIDELLALGTRSIVAVTAGFAETGEQGRAREREIVLKLRSHDAVMLGPNCNGTFDASAEFSSMAFSQPPPGDIAVISQSGSVVLDIGARLKTVGLGVGRAASVGNQADVSVADLVRSCVGSTSIRAIVLYVEDALDGRELFRDIANATAAGMPVIVLTPDANEAVNRAAMSHTGALVSSHQVVEEAARQSGALRVSSFAEAVHMVQAVLSPVRPKGTRVAVIADGGGFGVLGASAAAQAGLGIPALPADTQNAIGAALSPGAGVLNPVDLVGVMDVRDVPSLVATVLEAENIDGALLNISEFVHDTPELEAEVGRQLVDVAVAGGKPVVLATIEPDLPGPRAAAEAGLPVYRDMQPAARALAALARLDAQPAPPPLLPPPAMPLALSPEDYLGAKEVLAEAGVPFAAAVRVATSEEAIVAADAMGYPVVVKALGLLHKSDSGGVALRLTDARAVAAAVEDMNARLGPVEFAVEEMLEIPDAIELIVGGHQDARFGPALLVGIGGIYSEVLRDTTLLLAPTNEEAVVAKLESLRGSALLRGARGKAPVDLNEVARLVFRVSEFIARHPEIQELDLNPVLAGATRVVALDARIVI